MFFGAHGQNFDLGFDVRNFQFGGIPRSPRGGFSIFCIFFEFFKGGARKFFDQTFGHVVCVCTSQNDIFRSSELGKIELQGRCLF